MNVIAYFDRVRIINLALRKDRRSQTTSEFEKHGFPINTEKVNFFDAISPNEPEGFPNPGVRGCFLSHLKVLEDAYRMNSVNTLTLEDDIQFSKYISRYGVLAIKSLQNLDWDIAYFGHNIQNTKDGKASWKRVDQPMLLAHFYAVNGKALGKLTRFLRCILERPPGHPDGGPMHYDGALNTFMQQNHDIRAYYYSINLGYQRPSKTDLHGTSIVDKYSLLKPLSILVRSIKSKYMSIVH